MIISAEKWRKASIYHYFYIVSRILEPSVSFIVSK